MANDDGKEVDGADVPLAVLRTYATSFEAELARMVLEAHDIPAFAQGDDAGGMEPALGYLHGVRLYVRWSDAIAAGAVLDAEPADEGVDDDSDDESDDDDTRDAAAGRGS